MVFPWFCNPFPNREFTNSKAVTPYLGCPISGLVLSPGDASVFKMIAHLAFEKRQQQPMFFKCASLEEQLQLLPLFLMAWGDSHPWHWCSVSPLLSLTRGILPTQMLCQGDWNISLKGCILFSPLFRKIHTCMFPPSVCCHSHVFSENEPTYPQLGHRAAFALPNPARPWLMDWGRRSDLIWANWMICPDDWNWVMLMLPTPSWDERFVRSGTVGATKCIEKLRNNCKREGWVRWAGRSRGVCVGGGEGGRGGCGEEPFPTLCFLMRTSCF